MITDNGNMIVGMHILGQKYLDPENLEIQILQIAGVVQVGLFNNMCDAVVLAGSEGVQTIRNPNGRLNS